MIRPQSNGQAGANLLPQHREDLRKSGLSDETIKACGFHSLTTDGLVRRALGWKWGYRGKLGPCLAIPVTVHPSGNRLGQGWPAR